MTQDLAIVTGGASGIGLAIVERLVRDGAHVYLVDRNEAAAEREAQRLRTQGASVQAVALDVSDEAAVKAWVATLEPVRVLVNNAGVFDMGPLLEVSHDDFRRHFEINFLSVVSFTEAVAQKMPGNGRIVNISSLAYLSAPDYVPYGVSKAAVASYTRSAARALAHRGILVNAIAPGVIDTPILQGLPPGGREARIAQVPLKKVGRPEDIAQAVAFLSSRDTDFITGQVLLVDGGRSMV